MEKELIQEKQITKVLKDLKDKLLDILNISVSSFINHRIKHKIKGFWGFGVLGFWGLSDRAFQFANIKNTALRTAWSFRTSEQRYVC